LIPFCSAIKKLFKSNKIFQFLGSPDEIIIDEQENSQEMQALSPTTPPPQNTSE